MWMIEETKTEILPKGIEKLSQTASMSSDREPYDPTRAYEFSHPSGSRIMMRPGTFGIDGKKAIPNAKLLFICGVNPRHGSEFGIYDKPYFCRHCCRAGKSRKNVK